jgi:hypothetical protein
MTTTAGPAGRALGLLDWPARGRLACWVAAAAVTAGTTASAMWHQVTLAGKPRISGSAFDFASTTWDAARGLLAGQDVYAVATRVAGMPANFPAGPHVPATLTWQAPFAALPLWQGFFAFDFAAIAAIWAAVFMLTRPRSPQALLIAACCGSFAILTGAGQWALRMGQPTGFELLGMAILVRARKPWVAALGFMLVASTFQTSIPVALGLVVLGAWPALWRGAVLVAALSVPPIMLGISAAGGLVPYVRVFTMSAFGHLGALPGEPLGLADHPGRVDLGALLHRAGIDNTGLQLAAGLLLLALTLVYLARLPPELRRLDSPPTLCLVIASTVLCAYHQPYDLLLVAGAVIPVFLLAGDRSTLTLGIFALAGISAGVADNKPPAVILVPICLLAMAALAVLAARRSAASHAADTVTSMTSEVTSASGVVADGLAS